MNGFNRPYVFNNSYFTPVYVSGENYSFYLNMFGMINELDRFALWVIKTDGTQVFEISSDINKLYIRGSVGYDLYLDSFLFPFIPDGEHYFQIWDIATSTEKARSNIILVSSSENVMYTTTPVRFRHNDQLFGVRYDLLPNFWQKFRLPVNQIKSIDVRSTREQYRQSSGNRQLRNSKSFRDIFITLEFYWADDEDFEALSAILEHSDIWISGNRIIDMTQVKVEKPLEASKLSKGTFEIIVDIETEPEDDVIWGGSGGDFSLTIEG